MDVQISRNEDSQVMFGELRHGDLFQRPGSGAAIKGFEIKRGKLLEFGIELQGGLKFAIRDDENVFRLKIMRVTMERVYNENKG